MRPSLRPITPAAAAILLGVACSQQPAPSPAPAPAGNQTAARTPARSDSTPAEGPAGAARGAQGGQGGGGAGGQQQAEPNPRPYARVVTREANTRNGLFKVHRIGNRLLFEIPRKELGKDQLLVSEIAKTTLGVGYGGQALNNRVLRWERRDNRVLLRGVSYQVVATDTTSPMVGAVQAANVQPIISVFNVEAYGPDSSMVIDVTRMFTQVPLELSPAQRISPRAQLDANRSFIERGVSFPDNVNVETTLTFNNPPAPGGGGGGGGQPQGGFGQQGTTAPSATVVMNYSFHKLPEVAMKPRLCDSRVGYFSQTVLDYSRPEHRAQERCYISRYRLEKKDAEAPLSEPVKPIVYYIDRNTPKEWVPYLIKGIEDWQPAFEAAGFKNAILGKLAPNDPDWSPEDARYSVIRWLPSTTENASGPSVRDPRSGEILNAHIQFYHNVMTLGRTWYYTQVAALDPRARTFPLPEALMGELIRYVAAHEVGHTLGFQHNMKASSAYAIDSIRNASFVKRMGHTPTLMDYSRFNYVAQPEDNIPVQDLIPKIGPYDIWATKWGYSPIDNAKTADDERRILDAWAREQDAKPYLRFSTRNSFGSDPGEMTEAVGDIDAVKATELGMKNLKRGMQWLEQATVKPTEDFDELQQLYQRMVNQWRTEMNHVVTIVGGASSQEKYGGQPGPRFVPLSAARQKAAMKFLADNAFQTPSFLVDQNILRKIEPVGGLGRIEQAQASVLGSVLNDARMSRLVEYQAMSSNQDAAYSLGDMLGDLRRGVWSELSSGSPKVDAYRRALQRSYVTQIGNKIRPPAATGQQGGFPGGGGQGAQAPAPNVGEIRNMLRGELRDLDRELAAASEKAGDRETRLHVEGIRAQIKEILEPKA
jgi:hypothetical protein